MKRTSSRAFTLIELMASTAALIAIILLCSIVIGRVNDLWVLNKARLNSFQESRLGFEYLARQIAQATLNVYWDYDSPSAPTSYVRASDLHFIMGPANSLFSTGSSTSHAIFFQSPEGYTEERGQSGDHRNHQPLRSMLCASGFYLAYGPSPDLPAFLANQSRQRSRLYRYLEPGEQLSVYASSSGNSWFGNSLSDHSSFIAENVIGLIFRARIPSQGNQTLYRYDSRDAQSRSTHHQLPPIVSVTMVVIDEASALRLGERYRDTDPPVPFSTSADYEQDLQAWKDHLDSLVPKVNYRIFTADIAIKGSKWSTD